MTRLFLLAGETSGDRLGGALMDGLTGLDPSVRFSGVGGPAMQARGLQSLYPMEDLSVMGLAEVLPAYRRLKRRLGETAAAVLRQRPDALITIDSPDFSLRLARRVRAKCDIRTVHYVAPSVWAWRAGRAGRMAGTIDQVLALLPFEPALMRAAGLRCDFVGHPAVAETGASARDIAALRAGSGVGDAAVLLVLPGSRPAEVRRLAPVFGRALQSIVGQRPDLRIVVPAAPAVADAVAAAVGNWPGRPVVLDPHSLPPAAAEARKRASLAMADVAIAASGSVSLDLAAADTPMVIAYDLNWLSWQVMSRMLTTDTVTLVNLVSGTRAVPECLGPRCTAPAIAAAALELLTDPDARAAQRRAMQQTMTALGRGGDAPGLRAARAVLDGLA